MNFESSENLLKAVSKNVDMAIKSLEMVLPLIEDSEFKEFVSKLNSDYSVIMNEIEMIARANDFKLKSINVMEKAELWTSVKFNTLTDKSVRKIANMIYIGTQMGIPDLIIALCDFDDASNEIKEIAQNLKSLEENSSETLKLYLCK